MGGGGTDFRPAFARIEELRAEGPLRRCRGCSTSPTARAPTPPSGPRFEVAFLFLENGEPPPEVPPWAMRLCCSPRNFYSNRKDEDKSMDIQRAKEEIKDTVRAYLACDDTGCPLIPPIPPAAHPADGPSGVGKTQIMEQIAQECDIALVAYTITHHPRQSAVGLPFIRERNFGGRTRSVTEYTMSEIIASVYAAMERTGKKNGILFIDEINCVSETLAPTMLQFLQCKTFGNQAVPGGLGDRGRRQPAGIQQERAGLQHAI